MARGTAFEAREILQSLRAEGSRARACTDETVFEVDLRTGEGITVSREAGDAFVDDEFPDFVAMARRNWQQAVAHGVPAGRVPTRVAVVVGRAILSVHDDRVGETGLSTTVALDGVATTVPGEARDVVSVDGGLVGLTTEAGVFVVDAQRSRVLAAFGFARANDAVHLAARDDVVVAATGGALHVIDRNRGWTRIPFAREVRALAVTDAWIVLASSNQLFAVDRVTIPASLDASADAPSDEPLVIAPRVGASADDDACVVRTSVRNFVALTEVRTQRHFNFTLASAEAGQRFAKGDRVYVVDNDVVKEADMGSRLRAPEPTLHATADLPPLPPVAKSPSRRVASEPAPPAMETLRAEIGFAPDPMLLRFLALSSHAWCWPFGAFVPTAGLPSIRSPVDPCLVTLFDADDGVRFGIYDYPPARHEGHAFVKYFRDEIQLIWLGRSFGDALASCLEGALQLEVAPRALEILRAMELPITFLDEHIYPEAPSWFTAAHPQQDSPPGGVPFAEERIAAGDRLRDAGDLVGAERCYVRALHATYDAGQRARIADRLDASYAALQWPFQARRVKR